MTRRLLTARLILIGSGIAASFTSYAQTFKVEKFDIKGDGGTDYVAVESATGRVFVSRGTHMMVVDGLPGKSSVTFRTLRECMAPESQQKRAMASQRMAWIKP